MPRKQSFELRIEFGNAAFDSASERLDETARILRHAADEVEAGKGNAYLYDVNGNKVGDWSIDPYEEPEEEDAPEACCEDPSAMGDGTCANCGGDFSPEPGE